ncbi:hypothetical protein B0H13DRAFT_2349682 [Mycena leptocephala]|nr:hypothetical protein B0H13DRAFT_2349682 [Mycena leptocephala]
MSPTLSENSNMYYDELDDCYTTPSPTPSKTTNMDDFPPLPAPAPATVTKPRTKASKANKGKGKKAANDNDDNPFLTVDMATGAGSPSKCLHLNTVGEVTPTPNAAVTATPAVAVILPALAPVVASVTAPIIVPVAAPIVTPFAVSAVAPVAAPVVAPFAMPAVAPVAVPIIAPIVATIAAPIAAPATVAPTPVPAPAPMPAPVTVAAPIAAPIPPPANTLPPVADEQLLQGVPTNLLGMYKEVTHPKFFLVVNGGNGPVMKTHGLIHAAIGSFINIDPTNFTLGTPHTAANRMSPALWLAAGIPNNLAQAIVNAHIIASSNITLFSLPYNMPVIDFVGVFASFTLPNTTMGPYSHCDQQQ